MIKKILFSVLLSALLMGLLYFTDKSVSKEEGDYIFASFALIAWTFILVTAALTLLVVFATNRFFNVFLAVFIPIAIVFNIFEIYWVGGFLTFSLFISSEYVLANFAGLAIMLSLYILRWVYRKKEGRYREIVK